jgi:hypothetical protein
MYFTPALVVFFPTLGHLPLAKFAALAFGPEINTKVSEMRNGKILLDRELMLEGTCNRSVKSIGKWKY